MRNDPRVRIVKPDVPRSTLLPNEPLHAPNFRFRPLRSERHTPGKAMSEPITPALTPDEWREQCHVGKEANIGATTADLLICIDPLKDCARFVGDDRSAVAALALHGQPFGFGWKDVDELRSYSGDGWHRPVLESIADRIAALLPPRDA